MPWVWMGKGYGKGYGGGGGGGKGKGKGKGRLSGAPDQKVWIGNLPEDLKWKDLQTTIDESGIKSAWVEVFGGKNAGTGAVVFKTAEDALEAVAKLNGTVIGGQAVVFDTWVPKPKEEGDEDARQETSQEDAPPPVPVA
mmetsp:Transcript_23720/g.60488  ORF Transcript_23720/g.60488 Transcript_23720/m.60488 type:complete len:139 (-) Transcript_23720:75-491(-)